MRCAIERAERTALAEQHDPSASFSASRHSSSVTAATEGWVERVLNAATALSTPPLMATSTRSAHGCRSACSTAAAPRARASASAARSAACSFPALRPPSSAATSALPTRAASSSGSPRTSSTQALAAAVSAPHPDPLNPASATVAPSTRTSIRTRSPQIEPPAVPAWPFATAGLRPTGWFRCSEKRSSGTRPSVGELLVALLAELACVEHRLVDFLDLGVADDRAGLVVRPDHQHGRRLHDLHASGDGVVVADAVDRDR